MASKLIVNNLESLATGRDITVDSLVTDQQLAVTDQQISALETTTLERVIRVNSIAELEAYSVPAGYVFSLNAGGRSGDFDVVSGDFSTELSEDTANGVYVALSDNLTATTKVARRRGAFSGYVLSEWFGLTDTFSTHSPALKAANAFLYSIGGGELRISGYIQLNETFEIYPFVKLIGTDPFVSSRIEKSFSGGTMIRTTKPTGWNRKQVIGAGISGVTLTGDVSSVCIDLNMARYCVVEFCEIALGIGIAFNKKAREDGEIADGESYFNKVTRCNFASNVIGAYFIGATNRNTFELNSYSNCTVALDFSASGNVSETNVFINENMEGCHSAFEWNVSSVFSQTFIGLTVENPASNGYVCRVRDPGRQNFFGIALIPAGNTAAVDLISLTDRPSIIIGTRGSSAAFSYGVKMTEQLSLYDNLRTTKYVRQAYSGTLLAGEASGTISIPFPGAGSGDIVFANGQSDLSGMVLSAYAATDLVRVRVQNVSNYTLNPSFTIVVMVVKTFNS